MARKVAVSMPPITPVPMAFWLPEPAPEKSPGTTPRMKASEVIRMGRRRWRAAWMADSISPPPTQYSLANSTIRIAFAARPTVVSSPTWKYTSLDSPRSRSRPAPR